jgi:biotin synthase
MNDREFRAIEEAAETCLPVSSELVLSVLRSDGGDLLRLFASASRMRDRALGKTVRLCSILNARSGACSEDCGFCAQGACHETNVRPVPVLSEEEILEDYERAAELPISHFGVVTSGCALSSMGIDRVRRAIRARSSSRTAWCASLGCIDRGRFPFH